MKSPSTDFSSLIDDLNSGKILIYPTETLYGLGVDAQNELAVRSLFQLKRRSLSKPVPVLLPKRQWIGKYCPNIPEYAERLMEVFWPGPLTLILKAEAFPMGVRSEDGSVGFRVSSHPFVHAFLSSYGKCLTSTSANVSDRPPISSMDEAIRSFPPDSFTMIEDPSLASNNIPSTVVDCTKDKYQIVRTGALSLEKIEEVL